MLEIESQKLEPMHLVAVHHVGPFEETSKAWRTLNEFVSFRRLVSADPNVLAIGVCHDDPSCTPPEHFRYDACLVVNDEAIKRENLTELVAECQPSEPGQHIRLTSLDGGKFVKVRHVGPYARTPAVYTDLLALAEREGAEVDPLPLLKVYLDHPLFTPPERLRTDLLVRIKDSRRRRKS